MLRALPLWRSRKSDPLSKVVESWERGMVAPLREGVAGNEAPGGGPWGGGGGMEMIPFLPCPSLSSCHALPYSSLI